MGAAAPRQPLAPHLQALRDIHHVVTDFARGMTTDPPDDDGRRAAFGDLCDIFAVKVIPRLTARLAEIDPAGDYAAAAAETAAVYQDGAKAYRAGERDKDRRKPPFDRKRLEPLSKVVERRLLALSGETDHRKLRIPWGNMIGWMMSVPVNDGRYVYTSLGQGATACYDLSGNLVWARRMPEGDGNRVFSVQSPLLVDGVLVDMHQGWKELVGLDAQTGKELWRTPTKGDFAFGTRGGYYVGSHKVVTLTGPDRQPLKVIVTTLCNIIRPKDGKPLGAIPFAEEGLSGGPSIMCSGDIVMKGCNGDGFSTPYVAYRLAFEGPERVVAKELWRLPKTHGYSGHIATDKAFIISGKRCKGYDAATGTLLFELGKPRMTGSLMLGSVLMGTVDTGWRGPIDGKVATPFCLWDLSDPANPRRLRDDNLIGGDGRCHYVEYETYAPELMAHPECYHNWGARPGYSLHADTPATASGNRVFIRTNAMLYCIGDPNIPYDGRKAIE